MKRTLAILVLTLAAAPAFAQTPDSWLLNVASAAGAPLSSTTVPASSVSCGLAPSGAGVPSLVTGSPTTTLRVQDPSNAAAECALAMGATLPVAVGSYALTLSAVYTSVSLPFVVAPQPPLQSIFVKDSFTGATGTAMTAHTGEIGATWTSHAPNNGARPGSVVLTDAGRIRGNSAALESLYIASGIPPTPQYVIEADFWVATIIAGQYVAVMGRVDPASLTYYDVVTDGHTWYVAQVVNGAFTTLGSCPVSGPTAFVAGPKGPTGHVIMQLLAATVAVTVNGAACFSFNNPVITAAGRVGVAFFQTSVQSTNTTGIHIDNLVAHTP